MYFLVDFENVRSGGLRGVDYLEVSDYLTIFFSNAAHSCESRYLEDIERSGCHFDTCKLKKTGKNGLDFYIASRVGEFYGAGHKDQVAIISKDQGYKAVRDYWDVRLPSNNKIIISPSVERGLIASNDNSDRVKRLKEKLAGVDIDVFQARYDERMRLQEILRQIFGETDYASKMPEIQNMMETAKTPKIIYLNSLHRFGKKQGLEIYRQIRSVIHQNAAQA
ncbi:MAG: PIN domain-containing protein [Eubacteriales bacterium]|nr:PIN domain-containing protein [Eubacteriales bacterium]